MIGPALRYYFGSSNIKPYLEGDYITGFTKYDEGKIKVNGWDLGAGLAFFLNDYISLDVKLGYANATAEDTAEPDYEIKTKGFALSAGFSILF